MAYGEGTPRRPGSSEPIHFMPPRRTKWFNRLHKAKSRQINQQARADANRARSHSPLSALNWSSPTGPAAPYTGRSAAVWQ